VYLSGSPLEHQGVDEGHGKGGEGGGYFVNLTTKRRMGDLKK
jgi:hypothetical protein